VTVLVPILECGSTGRHAAVTPDLARLIVAASGLTARVDALESAGLTPLQLAGRCRMVTGGK